MTKFSKALLSLRFFLAFNLHLDRCSISFLRRKGNDLLLFVLLFESYFVDGRSLLELPVERRIAYGSYVSSSSNELSFELLLPAAVVPYVDAPCAIDFFSLDIFLSFFLDDGDNFHNRKRVNDAVSATRTIRYSFGSYKYTLVDDSESNSLARLIPKVSGILFEVVKFFCDTKDAVPFFCRAPSFFFVSLRFVRF